MFYHEDSKRPVWVATSSMQNGVRRFSTPVLHNWNWRGLNTDAEMQAFGPEYVDYRQAVADASELDNLRRFDRVWMDTAPHDPTDPLAKDADFFVVGVTKGVTGGSTVLFKRLSPDA